jgi:hypothetical protein
VTADEIRTLPIPFKEGEVKAGMSKESVDWAIKVQQLVLLRELVAQLAEIEKALYHIYDSRHEFGRVR